MKEIEISCRIHNDDVFTKAGVDFSVDLFSKDQYHYTFWDGEKRKLYQSGQFSNTAIDLLYISLMVYYADRKISRKREDDAWTRQIKLYMPVLEIEIWNENRGLLEKMLSFLSGDLWTFEFRKRELNPKEEKAFKGIKRQKKKQQPNALCMLSGGLDSFIGAIDILSKEKNVWFVGHYGGGKGVSKYQTNVLETLKSHFQLSSKQFYNFFASPLKGIEDTTRTRSFLFFAHAIILGSSVDREIPLFIPENGFISLNIPLTNTRLGSSSTRTTHPYYMIMFQQLLVNIGIKIKFYNPYQFKSKGQMIEECTDPNFLKANIVNTMSCSHPDLGRYSGDSDPSHCGTCLPCIIRRASIEYAYGSDSSSYRDKNFEKLSASENLRSFKIGVRDYLESKTDTLLTIQTSGPINDQTEDYCRVYKKGMTELISFLDRYNG